MSPALRVSFPAALPWQAVSAESAWPGNEALGESFIGLARRRGRSESSSTPGYHLLIEVFFSVYAQRIKLIIYSHANVMFSSKSRR